ncbi:MAG: MaoC family dehydratase N-terminal domain-containing protein [Proteobacteria bacterium]|nr:MaoC family dehydratase N-terminal domain-containing protein [Pseudomonadota bacterium]
MTQSNDLRLWVGRQERRTDWLNPNHLAAWNATLDRDDAFPREGDAVPPGFHWTLFPPLARQSELGPDGHPKKGGFLPPVPLPRRMWAGGQLRFHQPLLVSERVERVSTIESVEEKHGKSGPLVFVTVRHILSGAHGPAIEELHDIVYREAPKTGAAPAGDSVQPAETGAWRREVVPDDVLLFRYSALTFNGHRIHYDRRYVTDVEGYPGLIVHGPLIATLLLDLLRRQLPQATLDRFSFKALRPTYDVGPFSVLGGPGDKDKHFRLWSTDNQGQTAMEAEAWIR